MVSLIRSAWVVLAGFTVIASPSLAGQSTESDPPPQVAVGAYTPLLVQGEAAVRGITLGGDAKMSQIEPHSYKMSCGVAMITCIAPSTVEVCSTKVLANAHTTFVIDTRTNAVRVLNLNDRKKDSLKVLIGSNHLVLNPGEELVLLSKEADVAEVMAACTGVKFRRPQLVQADGARIMVLELSLSDALQHCVIFQKLKNSPDPSDHKLLSEIVKTAAAVNTMYSKSREKYTLDGQAPDSESIAKKEKVAAKKARVD